MSQATNGQAPPAEQKQLAIARINSLQTAIQENYVQTQLKNALADNAGAFAASIVEIFSQDKYLQQCDPKQVIMQCLKAAVLKLPISKSLGHAWIIAYKGQPQFQIGYKGLIQLAYRTNFYRHIHCDEVYEGEYKSANKLTGEFDLSGTKKNDTVVGYFAYFELLNGLSKTLYMTVDRIRKHAERYSPSYNYKDSAWKTDFAGMAKKTVLRLLLSHWGYLTVEIASAMERDEDFDPADEVLNEIRGNGNMKTTGFTDVETVDDPPPGSTDQGSNDNRPPF